MNAPSYWKTDLDYIDNLFLSASHSTEKRVLTRSAGDRPVYMLSYGEKKVPGTANYSSALGSKDKSSFSPANQKPCIIIIGAVHGQETEGVAAITNLISLLETGFDLAGQPNDDLIALARQARIVLVPVANPDGRARVKLDSMIGCTMEELRYWGQGTWKDGSPCNWPDCKKVHPIIDSVDFLGGYYNDDGINIMHDNFFHPMARETQALLDLCAEECADFVLHMHGGGNDDGGLLQPAYVTKECNLAVDELYQRCQAVGQTEGLSFFRARIPELPSGAVAPSFNLVSAVHHVCGAVSACYESNECIIDEEGPKLSHAEIIRMQMILFTETIKLALEL